MMCLRIPNIVTLTLLLATVVSAVSANAEDWGSLKGKFVYSGKSQPEKIEPTKDPEFCSKHELVDETVTVGENGELQNVFVYLYLNIRRGEKVSAIHPDYTKDDAKPIVLDNKGCRFEPHALTLWTRNPLEIRNSDPVAHNTNAGALFNNPGFNDTIPQDKPVTKEFEKSESYPAPIACNIHPWMKAYLLIRDNPYMAISNEKGEFEIKNLPAGKHKFIFWHDPKGIRDLEVGGDETDRRGTAQFEIPAGETLDLGTITITPEHIGK